MSNSKIKKYKFIGAVRPNHSNPNILIYLSNGEVNPNFVDLGAPKEGLVETKHYVSGDVDYWSEEQFKKWFKPL